MDVCTIRPCGKAKTRTLKIAGCGTLLTLYATRPSISRNGGGWCILWEPGDGTGGQTERFLTRLGNFRSLPSFSEKAQKASELVD